MKRALLVVMAGCGFNSPATVHNLDAPIDLAVHASAAKSHVLYIAAEGVTLSPAAAPDATNNATPLVSTMTTFTAWHASTDAPSTAVHELASAVEHVLDPYGVAVVVVRPEAPPYTMIVVTETPSSAVSAPVGAGCNAADSDVAFVFDLEPGPAAQSALSLFAFVNGVPLSATAGDCLHLGGTTPCTLAASTQLDPVHACGDANPAIDERAELMAAFGGR